MPSATNLITYALAIVICTAAAAAGLGHLLRKERTDRLLLWFAVFAAMYGGRMFFKQPLAEALGVRRSTGLWVEDIVNYFILIPALLFFQELYGRGWRQTVRSLPVCLGVFAIAATVIDLATGDPGRIPDPSMPLLGVLVTIIIVGATQGYVPRRFDEWRILVAGVCAFILFVVNNHFEGARIGPWRAEMDLEPIGFLVQLGCFGYIAVARVLDQGRRLVAIDQEMRSAREIQAAILPRDVPSVGRVRITARYVPLAAVAGDFYDVVDLNDGAVALLVADVSGHGVPAALIASMVKVAFTAGLRDTTDPAGVLQHMNATLCGMFERSYVTAACVIVHPDQQAITYALAGHPPPLLAPTRGADVVRLDERGVFLGLIPGAAYTTARAPFGPGGRLVIYTDGITETPGNDEDLFGVDRLVAFTESHRLDPGTRFVETLIAELRRFAHSPTLTHDDLTVVVAEMTGAAK